MEGPLQEDGVDRGAARRVDRALWLYSALVVVATAAAWTVYRTHGKRWYYRPLFLHEDRFHDLTNYTGKIAHLQNGAAALARGLPVFNYPAPAAYVYKFLLHFHQHAVTVYLALLGAFTLGFAAVAWRASGAGRRGRLGAVAAIATTALLGFPLWFTADRGNIEGVVWALSAAGVCLLLRSRYWSAAALIGAAASVKPFPALLFLLLLGRRRYWETGLGLLVGGVLFVSALWGLGPNPWQAYLDLKPGVTRYMEAQGMNLGAAQEARFEHSLLDGMKSAALARKVGGFDSQKAAEMTEYYLAQPQRWAAMTTLMGLYLPMAAIGLGLLIALFYRMPILNQATAAGVAITLFPLVSSEYTLLHLYVPFGAFVVFAAREVGTGQAEFPGGAMMALAAIYALLFSPLTFLQIYAGDAKLLLLLALLFVARRWPMRSAYFGDRPAARSEAGNPC